MQPESALATLPRPNEKVAIVSFLLVFLCGALLGAVIMSVSGHAGLHAPVHGTRTEPGSLSMSVMEWKQQLDLTEEQTAQITSILDDFSRYYDNVLADGNTRIIQILNPVQRGKFERMLRAHKR